MEKISETLNTYNAPVSYMITKQEYDCLEILINAVNDIINRLEKYDYSKYKQISGNYLNNMCQTGLTSPMLRDSLDDEYQKALSMKRKFIKKLLDAESEFTNSYNAIRNVINQIDIRPNIMVNIKSIPTYVRTAQGHRGVVQSDKQMV